MNHKTLSLFFLNCFVIILFLSSITFGRLQGHRGDGYNIGEGLHASKRTYTPCIRSPPSISPSANGS
ncbi:hypothetical protein P3L10_031265 [Capsicum annuum]